MKKLSVRFVITFIFLFSVLYIAGCGSGSDRNGSGDDGNTDEESYKISKNDLTGSWLSQYKNNDGCDETVFASFLDGQFSFTEKTENCTDPDNDDTKSGNGTWTVDTNGLVQLNITEATNGDTGTEDLYCFIASNEKLAVNDETSIFKRSGNISGSNVIGTWTSSDDETVIFKADGTWSWTKNKTWVADDEEIYTSGTYIAINGKLTLTMGGLKEYMSFNLFNSSTLAISGNDRLFEKLTLDSNYFGSWISNAVNDQECNEISIFSFESDGTFAVKENDQCNNGLNGNVFSGKGVWGIAENGLLRVEFTGTDTPGMEKLFSFLTDSEELSIRDEDSVFIRKGQGTGLVGTWEGKEGPDCDATLVITATTWEYETDCGDSENNVTQNGSYTTDNGVITRDEEGGETRYSTYKIFDGSILSITDNDELYVPYDESEMVLDPALFGSWVNPLNPYDTFSIMSFSVDGTLSYTYDNDPSGIGETWEAENGLLMLLFGASSDESITLYYYLTSTEKLMVAYFLYDRVSGDTGIEGEWEYVDENCTYSFTFDEEGFYSDKAICLDQDYDYETTGTYEVVSDESLLLDESIYYTYHISDDNHSLIIEMTDTLYSKYQNGDNAFLECIDEALDLPLGEIPTDEELESLTSLDCSWRNITNISYVQDMTNLSELYLDGNLISDISPVQNLYTLEFLTLSYNLITDISALHDLTNLYFLNLNQNKIGDVTALENLTQMTNLYLVDTDLSDVSSLEYLESLEELDVSQNCIADLTPVNFVPDLINDDNCMN